MTALVINMGPVYGPHGGAPRSGDIGAVDWLGQPPKILTISGSGSSYFADLASAWTREGHILPQLLAHYGLSAGDYDSISLTGFSAGHGLAVPLLRYDGDQISAAVMFDACFSLTTSPKGKVGYAEFGARAIRGERLLVLTSSHGQNGPGLPPSWTGSDCALDSFGMALASTGVAPEIVPPPEGIPGSNPKGNYYGAGELVIERAGNFFVLDYGALFSHGDHTNLLSRDVLSVFLAPYIDSGSVPGGNSGPSSVAPPGGEPADGGELAGSNAGAVAAVAMMAVVAVLLARRGIT